MVRFVIAFAPFLFACNDVGVRTSNADPEAKIISPTDGASTQEGYVVPFVGAVTDPGDDLERSLISAGFQVDFAFTLTHRLPMTLSLGYAIGREGGKKRDDEWLVSLKIL